ncbi:TPA: thermonuclease family protein [Escherichia coli]|nr:thermonuclease family protein [Escherichia coli]
MKRLFLLHIFMLPVLLSCVPSVSAITVTRIIDGDTLEVKDNGDVKRIRLVDIDAPEKSQPFGQRAKQKLSELVKDADDVAVSSTGKDRYGRTLAKVYVKKCQSACLAYYVNAEMVKSGLAWAYRYHGKATSSAMEELERVAKQAKTGLWSLPDAVEPWRYRYEHKTQ